MTTRAEIVSWPFVDFKEWLPPQPFPAYDPLFGKSQHCKLDSWIDRTIAILPVQRFTYMLFFAELSFEIADGYAIMGLSLGQQLPERQNLSAQAG